MQPLCNLPNYQTSEVEYYIFFFIFKKAFRFVIFYIFKQLELYFGSFNQVPFLRVPESFFLFWIITKFRVEQILATESHNYFPNALLEFLYA